MGPRNRSRRERRRRLSAVAGVVGLVGAGVGMGTATAATAAVPTLTTGAASSATTTGAVVTLTINPNGDATLYQVVFGITGSPTLSQTTGYQDAGSGSAPETETVVLRGLQPGHSYSYQADAFDNTTGTDQRGGVQTLTTPANPAGPGTPIVPPATPPANGIFDGNCQTDDACLQDANGVRASQEALPPLALPGNYGSLTASQQMFVLTNLERLSRGEPAISELVTTYDASVQGGVASDNDPDLSNLPGAAASIWAGGNPTVGGAMYGWLYDDGLGSGNLDCTQTNQQGCWGHRQAILSNASTIGNPNEMDAIAGTDSGGASSYAATFVVDPNPPAPTASSVSLTWAAETPYLTTDTNVGASHYAAGGDKTCAKCTPPLAYQGGPVMGVGATTNQVTITPIFWTPPGDTAIPSSYSSFVDQYLTDLAARSASGTNALSVDAEYYQVAGGTSTKLSDVTAFGGEQDDSDALPTGTNVATCTPIAPATSCITKSEVTTELASYLAANNLPEDSSHLYPVFFPPSVETTDTDGSNSLSGYCGYHDATTDPTTQGAIFYTNEPYENMGGCGGGQGPESNLQGNTAIDTLSHEVAESETDPGGSGGPGWYDAGSNEIGDECLQTYGTPLGSTDADNPNTTMYNQVINGHDYYLQEEFSDAAYGAAGNTGGCIQDESQAAALTMARAQGGQAKVRAVLPAEDDIFVDAGAYDVPADGTSSTNVTVHVDQANGEPAANDPVHLSTESEDDVQGAVCGNLSSNETQTNADGDATVTYTASRSNITCDVIADEALTGQSGDVEISMGTGAADSASLAGTYPAATTEGSPATVTTTTANPGGAIDNAAYQVDIYGDDTSGTGVSASQLQLTYTGPSTGGKPVAVPLSGTTADDGDILGAVPPGDLTYGAGFTAHGTYHLTVAGSAPTTAATGTPLSMEVDLVQDEPSTGDSYVLDDASGDITVNPAPTPPPPSTAGGGYRMVGADGGVFAFGGAGFYGSAATLPLRQPVVGTTSTPDGKGYWEVAADGGVFAFGDASYHGSTGGMALTKPVVGMAATPDGQGYWLVASDGGLFAFGDATFRGSAATLPLRKPIVGMAATPDGKGYWLVASDGGLFAYGDAGYYGSTGGMALSKPVVGMAATPDGGGYWLVASDGGIFAFGDARYAGSTGAIKLAKPVVGMAATPDGGGYWLAASDGGIFAFGDAPYAGSLGGVALRSPIVAVAHG